MVTPDASATLTPPATADGLRIVLFGLPRAGKSSLLGALGQAAQTQQDLLHGRLHDLSHGLSDLQHRLYNEPARPTAEEVVPYPLAFQPFDEEGSEPISALVFDCDGLVAQELVARPRPLDRDVPSGSLATEIAGADTLVLAVDSSAAAERLEQDFSAFDRFLRELEEGRSERVEVGGLPVFLVLTKCDQLAQPGDNAADWIERIEQRKREVDQHFRDFLARRAGEMGQVPFGQLDLHLWATAVKRPALASVPAKPQEPYGVAELFRQCFESAAAYRRRWRQSRRRLFSTVAGAGFVVGALSLLALFLVVRPAPPPPSKLEIAIEALQFTEKATPAARLKAPLSELRQRRDRLRQFQHDPGFATLPEQLRTFVLARQNELDKYIDWMDQVEAVRRPVTVDTEAALRDIKQHLEKLGNESSNEWQGTDAFQLYQERFDEVNALLAGIQQVQTAYLGDARKALKLWTFQDYRTEAGGINWPFWSADLENLRRQFKPVTFKQTDKLSSSPALTYAAVMRFDTVIDASTLRQRLERVRDLAAALGLIGPLADRPPVLVIPKAPAFTLSRAKERLEELHKAYPHYQTEFSRAGLPEPFLRDVDRAAQTNYDALLEPARAQVLSHLPKAEADEKARWDTVRDWLLTNPEELAAWRALALVLVHLHEPSAPDPVSALAAFLQEPAFTLDVNRLTLELPEPLRGRVWRSSAALSLYHKPTDGAKELAMVFTQIAPDPHTGPAPALLAFERTKGKRVIYRPGDELWATLPLADNRELIWARNRTERFQLEAFWRPPQVHKASDDKKTGELVEGVRVRVEPADGWPRVPDLLPTVP